MRTEAIFLSIIVMLLGGCTGHCYDEPRPDRISVDASELLGHGEDFEVCIIPDENRPENELCAEVGSAQVSLGSADLPDSFGYVARWFNNDGQQEAVAGSFDLLCEAGTAQYFLGPDY
ncbi:MAG: hypothetical protein GY788_11340 [bacterium]|nr:hypothetical protein [bacterium]